MADDRTEGVYQHELLVRAVLGIVWVVGDPSLKGPLNLQGSVVCGLAAKARRCWGWGLVGLRD